MKKSFRCLKCGRLQDAELGPAEADPKVCPACGGELEVFSVPPTPTPLPVDTPPSKKGPEKK